MTKHIHSFATTLICALALVAATGSVRADSCTESSPQFLVDRPISCLQPPGWFDVGAGFAVMPNAGASGQSGSGMLVTIKGYPLGRWYAPLRTTSAKGNANLAATLGAADVARSNAEKDKQVAVLLFQVAAAKVFSANDDLGAAASTRITKGKTAIEGFTTATSLGDLVRAANELLDASKAADPDRSKKIYGAAEAARATLLAAEASQDIANAINSNVATVMDKALTEFGDNYSIAENPWWQQAGKRLSVFYGRSVGGFDTKVVDGDINVIGLAYDIVPSFALVWGRAWYNTLGTTGISDPSKTEIIFGVQLNLNAFKAMRGLTGSSM